MINMNAMIDLRTVLRELCGISGFRVSVHGTDFIETAACPESVCDFCRLVKTDPENHEKCIKSDGEAFSVARRTGRPYIYTCPFGLCEAVAPLYHFGVLSGYLMMGQVRTDGSKSDAELARAAAPFCADAAQARRAVSVIPFVDRDRLESYVNIMTICAEYITLTGKLVPVSKSVSSQIRKYINANYSRRITLDDLAAHFRCSKSTLMGSFKRDCSQTIVGYITEVRMKHAVSMLESADCSINDIALACGFCDQCYFSKTFSRKFKMTPSAYRALHRKEPEPLSLREDGDRADEAPRSVGGSRKGE